MSARVYIDFEAYSEISIVDVGPWVYSVHPSTEILCLSWRTKDEQGLWVSDKTPSNVVPIARCFGPAPLNRLFKLIADPDTIVEAHNAMVEKCLWRNIGEFWLGWPAIQDHQWRCSAAKAAACALPRALGDAGRALGLATVKDEAGHKIMLKLSRPNKKGEKPAAALEEWSELYEYCRTDTAAEMALSEALPDLTPKELEIWRVDQKMNWRGVRVDVEGAKRAVGMIEIRTNQLNAELSVLTGNIVGKATQRARLKKWLESRGAYLDDTKANTVDLALPYIKDEAAKQALTILRSIGRSSTAKYQTLIDSSDLGRAMDLLMYHGATTGRWCLPGDAEVLTIDGWTQFDQWSGGKIAQWRESGDIVFASATKVDFPYSGPMLSLQSSWLSSLSTPDHSFPIRLKDTGEIQKVLAGSINKSGRKELILAGNFKGLFEDSIKTRIIVMVQADGSLRIDPRHKNPKVGVRFGFRKQRKIDRCKNLLSAAGIPFSFFIDSEDSTRISISPENTPSWLKTAKQFDSWLFNHDPKIFIDELSFWDGCIDQRNSDLGISYSTGSKSNAEWVQTMAHLSGSIATIAERLDRDPNWSSSYRVHIHGSRTHDAISLRTIKKSSANFDGTVYCAVTQTGFFLTRYKGHIHVTGNTAKRFQSQNLPRGLKTSPLMDLAWNIIHNGTVEDIELFFGDPMELFSHALRGLIMADKGKWLSCGDYAAVETCVLFWIADELEGLGILARGEDIYLYMASLIFNRLVTKAETDNRQLGKQCLGADTLVLTSAGILPITEVKIDHLLWDGTEWISHGGLIHRGKKQTIQLMGLTITPEHPVLLSSSPDHWCSAFTAAQSENAKSRILETGSESLPLPVSFTDRAADFFMSLLNAHAADPRTKHHFTISLKALRRAVTHARRRKRTTGAKLTGGMLAHVPTMGTGKDCSIGFLLVSTVVTILDQLVTSITAGAEFLSMRHGEPTAPHFCNIFSRFRDGAFRALKWIGSTSIKAMNRVICVLSPDEKTCSTSAKSGSCSRESMNLKPVYDLVNAGPRHRFTIITDRGPVIVHNSILGLGFQMWFPKFLITCRTYKMQFSIAQIRAIVPPDELNRLAYQIEYEDWDRCANTGMTRADIPELALMKFVTLKYRDRYRNTVCALWKKMENAAKAAISNPGKAYAAGKARWTLEKIAGRDFLTARLPSGRKLYYPDAEYDGQHLSYMGVDSKTHQWVREQTYGGKLTENVVQAISRDLMGEAMLRCESAGYELLLTSHDELISQSKNQDPKGYSELIARCPPWAAGLPLKAESWCGERYRK